MMNGYHWTVLNPKMKVFIECKIWLIYETKFTFQIECIDSSVKCRFRTSHESSGWFPLSSMNVKTTQSDAKTTKISKLFELDVHFHVKHLINYSSPIQISQKKNLWRLTGFLRTKIFLTSANLLLCISFPDGGYHQFTSNINEKQHHIQINNEQTVNRWCHLNFLFGPKYDYWKQVHELYLK